MQSFLGDMTDGEGVLCVLYGMSLPRSWMYYILYIINF